MSAHHIEGVGEGPKGSTFTQGISRRLALSASRALVNAFFSPSNARRAVSHSSCETTFAIDNSPLDLLNHIIDCQNTGAEVLVSTANIMAAKTGMPQSRITRFEA